MTKIETRLQERTKPDVTLGLSFEDRQKRRQRVTLDTGEASVRSAIQQEMVPTP